MRSLMLISSLALCVACSKSEPAPTAEPAPAAPTSQASNKAAAPTPSIEDATFKLALVGEPGYTAGSASKASVVLEARGGYHVNQDYPIKVSLKAPTQLKLNKSELKKADAAEFGEQKARFEVPFTADVGEHKLLAEVDFAVCTAETCVPDQRTVALSLNVK